MLLAGMGLEATGVENESIVLPPDRGSSAVASADVDAVPQVDLKAVTGLKFSAALPQELAIRTLGERLADPDGAIRVTQMPVIEVVPSQRRN